MSTRNTASTPKSVPFNSIFIPEDENVRADLPKIKELATHIKEHGLIEPLVVVNGGSGSHEYRLVAGFRRAAALKDLKWGSKEIAVVVREEWDPLTKLGEGYREDFAPIDLASYTWHLVNGEYQTPDGIERRKHTLKEVASALGTSESSVRTYIRVHERLANPVRKMARKHPDVPLRVLHECVLEANKGGRFVEEKDKEGEVRKFWEPNTDRQIKIFQGWLDRKTAAEEAGRTRAKRGEGDKDNNGGDADDKDVYGFRREKIKGRNALMITAAVKVLQTKNEDELNAARAEALRFALGEITRLPGVTKQELVETIEAMRAAEKEETEGDG
jgi:hypothetical protein